MKRLAPLAALLLLAGCSPAPAATPSTLPAPSSASSAPTPTPVATTATPAPTPSEAVDFSNLAPGDTVSTLDDSGAELARWTVLGGKRTTSPYRDGPLYTAKVKVCADQKTTVSSYGWFVATTDDAQYDAASDQGEGDPTPMFPLFDKTLTKGRCLRGWIVFEVDKGAKVSHIGAQFGEDVAIWKVA